MTPYAVWFGGDLQAEASYVQLLRINPQSLVVLRNYAQFLLEVVNQDEKVRQARLPM